MCAVEGTTLMAKTPRHGVTHHSAAPGADEGTPHTQPSLAAAPPSLRTRRRNQTARTGDHSTNLAASKLIATPPDQGTQRLGLSYLPNSQAREPSSTVW